MSELRVSSLKGKKRGKPPSLPDGAVITGVTTSTFNGNLTGDVTGNITGTAGTFSGDVSVGGTISYEGVSDIDSVGVITARNGIKVGAGQSISPVSGIITYYGDGSGLTGVSAGSHNFVASGTIPNGATVVIRPDGKVGIVTISGSALSGGTPATFETSTCNWISATFDSNSNKVVIAYEDNGNSNYGTAIVGTVSGTSISFGSPVVYGSFDCNYNSIVFDSSNNKVVISYRDSTNTRSQSIVGTVSGTSISFGSPTSFITNNANPVRSVYVGSGKVVVIYRDANNSYHGYAIVGTVSGTSISFGSQVQFNGGNTPDLMPVYDSNAGKVVISYRDSGNNSYPTAIVGTVSGTSISFGSETVLANVISYDNCAVFDSTNNKVIVAYVDSDANGVGKAAVGTVSGTSISFGTIVEFASNCNYISMAYDSTNDRVHIKYADNDNSNYGTAIDGSVSGTNISFGTPYVFLSENMYYAEEGSTFDSNAGKVVHAYRAVLDGQAVVMSSTAQQTNLTAENYIGIAAETISDGQTGKITIVTGINEGQTGLTTGKTYYVQSSGGISTVASSPSVVAGTSISSTKIAVR